MLRKPVILYSIPHLPEQIKSVISCRTDPPFITRLDPQSESIYPVNFSQHGCTVIYLGRTLLCQTLAFARAPRSTMPALIWGASSADQTQTSQLLQRAATSFALQIDPHTHTITHYDIRIGEHEHRGEDIKFKYNRKRGFSQKYQNHPCMQTE